MYFDVLVIVGEWQVLRADVVIASRKLDGVVAKRLDQIVVIDVEATCWEGDPPAGQASEIIEEGRIEAERRKAHDFLWLAPPESRYAKPKGNSFDGLREGGGAACCEGRTLRESGRAGSTTRRPQCTRRSYRRGLPSASRRRADGRRSVLRANLPPAVAAHARLLLPAIGRAEDAARSQSFGCSRHP